MQALSFILTLAAIGVWVYAIMDSIAAPPEDVRYLPKVAWVILIILFGTIGGIAWLLFGRRRRGPLAEDEPRAGGGMPANDRRRDDTDSAWGATRRSRSAAKPMAPDDDPEFLRQLSERIRRDRES